MIIPIQITKDAIPFTEQFDLGKSLDPNVNIFTEAVFANGRQKLQPIVEIIKKLQTELNALTGPAVQTTVFSAESFVRNKLFKDLEFKLIDIFGFKHVRFIHTNEKYIGNGQFESRKLSAYTIPSWRYPIDGLITDSGFYDKTKSIELDVTISLAMLRNFTAEEVVGVFLHELGHNIDPSLVDIKFVKTNRLVSYIEGTDPTKKSEYGEGPIVEQEPGLKMSLLEIILSFVGGIGIIMYLIRKHQAFLNKSMQDRINQVLNFIRKDNRVFSSTTNMEAFADNFARMYGFGAEFIAALEKIEKNDQSIYHYGKKMSTLQREADRQEYIISFTIDMMKDSHGDNLMRTANLIKEYENDLADPSIPPKVKQNIQSDLDKIKIVLDMYLNHKDEFIRNLNRQVYKELTEKYGITTGADEV